MVSKPKRSRGGVMAGIDEEAERSLRQYLDERGWCYRWHDAVGAKVPEAIVLDDAGKPIAVVEATWLPLLMSEDEKPHQVGFLERAKRASEQGELAYSEVKGMDRIYSPHKRLEGKQEQAQAAAAQNLPFMLVMSNDIPFFAFGRDLHNLLEQYPEFSAIARLVERWAVSVARDLHERATLPKKEVWHPLTIVHDALRERHSYRLRHAQRRLRASLAEERRIAKVDFPVLYMEILLNPHATCPWLRNLIGVYDTVYEWDAQTEQFTVAYEGQFAIVRRLAVRLLAGSVSVPWQEAISTSRSEDFCEERNPATHSA